MSRKLRVSREARRDLDEIWFYIAQDSLTNADRFVDRLSERFPLLASMPHMGRSREDLAEGLRGFPFESYLILYRVQDRNIEIVRVLHAARDIEKALSSD